MSLLRPSPRLAAVVMTSAVLAGVGLTIAPASAAPTPPNRLTLTAATQSFTSSTGQPLNVDLVASGPTLTVDVTTPGQPETHTWAFSYPDSSEISYDPATGKGAVKTGSTIQPYGAMALTMTAIGKPTVIGCGRTRSDLQPVSVSGTLTFGTHSNWGKVGGPTPVTFSGNSNLVTFDGVDKLCGSTLPPCVTSSTWEAHNIASDLRGYTQFIGTSTTVDATTTSTLLATRLTYLATPANATRTDVSSIPVANPTFTFADPNASVVLADGDPHVTGSATLVGNSENAMPPLACGDSKHRTTNTAWQATYSNKVPPFTVSEEIEGNFHLTNVKGASNRANASINRIVTTTVP